MEFSEKVIVVIGGGKGLGREMAISFAKAGGTIIVTGRTIDPLESVKREINDLGRESMAVQMDIGDPKSVEEAANKILQTYGKIDVLVNNAAIGGPSAPLWEVPLEQWQETMDINVTGVYLCCKAFLPSMIKNKSGSILVIGSMSGKRPLENRTAYTTSKIALVGLVRTLAWEVGKYDIRVNLISPGPMEGDRLKWVFESQAESEGITPEAARQRMASYSPLNRFVDISNVADMAVFVASDKCSSTTGEDINASCGIAMI